MVHSPESKLSLVSNSHPNSGDAVAMNYFLTSNQLHGQAVSAVTINYDSERYSTVWAPAWPGTPGWPGLRLKWAKGRFGSKNDEKVKVLRMSLPIVENLSGLQESIFSLSR